MKTRLIGNTQVLSIGLGCMNLSHAYGSPIAPQHASELLSKAVDLGVTHFDTATLYGAGVNETLLGQVLSPFAQRLFISSKCGMAIENGVRVIDGRPETLRAQCEMSLRRLQRDNIDLYYLHRWDKVTPIEESVGALADLVKEGKINHIGLSEVSVSTLLKAHAVHPITAVQSEYSLWTRNPELGILAATKQIGAALVAFSPLGRGFLASRLRDINHFTNNDIRKSMPRFTASHFQANLKPLNQFIALAKSANCTPAQLALCWLLHQADHILPIPGTTQISHLIENQAALDCVIDDGVLQQAGRLINQTTISGRRYEPAIQVEIDTEDFALEPLA